jgi:hypothetical protein
MTASALWCSDPDLARVDEKKVPVQRGRGGSRTLHGHSLAKQDACQVRLSRNQDFDSSERAKLKGRSARMNDWQRSLGDASEVEVLPRGVDYRVRRVRRV